MFSAMSQLTNYIQKELGKGFSKDLITEKLTQAGYTKQEISESFKSLKSAEPLLRRKIADTIHEDAKVLRSKWLFPVLGIIVLIVLLYLVFQYVEIPSIAKTGCDTLEGTERDMCYLTSAAEEGTGCDAISSDFYKALCEQKLWETHECDYLFFTGGDKEQCLWNKAVETQDPAYCNKKVHDDIECLFDLAKSTNNPDMCDGELYCYEEYAVFIKDSSICELASEQIEKNFCYKYYNETVMQ